MPRPDPSPPQPRLPVPPAERPRSLEQPCATVLGRLLEDFDEHPDLAVDVLPRLVDEHVGRGRDGDEHSEPSRGLNGRRTDDSDR